MKALGFLLLVVGIFMMGWTYRHYVPFPSVTDGERIVWGQEIKGLAETNASLGWNLKICEELLQRDALDTFLGIYQATRM